MRAAALRALCVPLPGDSPDPVAVGAGGVVFASAGLALGGEGCALELALPSGLGDTDRLEAVRAELGAIETDDRVGVRGSGPLAFAAFGFERRAPTTARVPARLVGRDDEGRRWLTVVDPSPTEDMVDAFVERWREVAPAGTGPAATPRGVESLPPGPAYAKAVAHALVALDAGELDKVVLARRIDVTFDGAPDVDSILARLHAAEPRCTTFSLPVAGGTFLGASPELLVERRGDLVRCQPLAGTAGLDGTDGDDARATAALRASGKDLEEHRLVVADIAGRLAPWCAEVRVPPAPAVVRLATIAHLATTVEGHLARRADGSLPGVLELLARLHPTPAVGGVPLERALALIDALEAAPRGPWAGPVGWFDGGGDGQWVIGIRSAVVVGALATLYAGAGIVRGSEPERELAETTLKLAGVLEALAPGSSPRLLAD